MSIKTIEKEIYPAKLIINCWAGFGACSSAGRAPPLQGGGPGSESQQVHLNKCTHRGRLDVEGLRSVFRKIRSEEAVHKLCDQTLTEFSGA